MLPWDQLRPDQSLACPAAFQKNTDWEIIHLKKICSGSVANCSVFFFLKGIKLPVLPLFKPGNTLKKVQCCILLFLVACGPADTFRLDSLISGRWCWCFIYFACGRLRVVSAVADETWGASGSGADAAPPRQAGCARCRHRGTAAGGPPADTRRRGAPSSRLPGPSPPPRAASCRDPAWPPVPTCRPAPSPTRCWDTWPCPRAKGRRDDRESLSRLAEQVGARDRPVSPVQWFY